jgi:membrane-associated phospholipid phosphatase
MSPLWLQQIRQRFVVLWWLKGTGTTAFMFLFFWGYFAVLQHPIAEPWVVPMVWLDHWVPFAPSFFWIYTSLWVYVSLPPALLGTFKSLAWYGVWIALLCGLSLAFFWLLPSQTPEFDIDWGLYPGLAIIKGVDAAGNAFPSLHVATAVFSMFWLRRILQHIDAPTWLQYANVIHCLLIAWSTLAIRQHVALDLVAGLCVGALFAWLSIRHMRTFA